VLYDGPDEDKNPGRLDALYLVNLLGHFTTHRTVHPLETYKRGEWARYDAVFTIVYQKRYRVPSLFLEDIARDPKTFCWLGNQVGQLDRQGLLRRHGLRFIKLSDTTKFNQVFYKNRTLVKGDVETNLLKVLDTDQVQVMAKVASADHQSYPYAMHSDNFWVFADSPFSYSAENDRYLVLCDLLHDILGIQHVEDHPAILRIEDLNAMSEPSELEATLAVIRRHHIPFSFGFVPTYVNPHERLEFRMADKPDVVAMLKKYVEYGGTPVLHGFTHQYRGVTTDDYEFWDDLSDRPIRGDSETFVARRLEEAIRESMAIGLYPVTWETPHYAASPLDYRVIHRYFSTVFERRLAGMRLDSDQYFPYPVIDLYGQYVIPENLAYVPIDQPVAGPILANAEAASVVRDGYASVFFHPFLKPALLDEILSGIEKMGYHFIDLKSFPNEVRASGRVIKTASGSAEIAGHGRYLNEMVVGPGTRISRQSVTQVPPESLVTRSVRVDPGTTYVAVRQDLAPPNFLEKLFQIAKGNFSVVHRRLETVFPARVARSPVRTTILWDYDAKGPESRDQESFYSALDALGFDIEKINYKVLTKEELGPLSLLVIPWATARSLSADDIDRILGAVKGGITLITDGQSPLSRALGIRLGDPAPVSTLQDHLFVNQDTRWPDHPKVPWIQEPSPEQVNVYYSDRDEQHPLVIGAARGGGRYLYFAPFFDEVSGQGYSRFPSLPQMLVNELHASPIIRRIGADVYFDPGYRQAISIEVLARMWRRFGIRAVHVAAWHFYDKYAYDYERLVKVAHQNGILVYAWFEWPEVSERFWEKHPGWREKTALLTDAHVDWRFLMNLRNPQCLKAVLDDTQAFLGKYDWDGVNIGELTFDSLEGPQNPATFTPFNDDVRKEFQAEAHFDPVDLFDPRSPHYWEEAPEDLQAYYRYRRDVNSQLLKIFLEKLQELNLKRGKSWEIMVTLLDALQHPELADYLGIDFDRTIALLNQYGATLQVEDPSGEWQKPPSRYIQMGRRYRDVPLKQQPYMIDINVLSVHPSNQRGFATAQPTGTELVQLWNAAASQTPRVCFYSESTVNEQDWEIMPYAMGSGANVRKEGDLWIIKSPFTVRLEVGRDTRKYRLDGLPWFCAEKGEVLIPPGEHQLSFQRIQRSWFDTTQLDTYLLSITGELLGSQRVLRGLEVEYRSPTRCALMFNKTPYKVFLDEQPFKANVIKGDSGFTILAPPGQHRLRVISETPGLYAVEFTSLVTASLIVIFGLASSGLLAFLFLFVTLNRRTSRLRRTLWRRFRRKP